MSCLRLFENIMAKNRTFSGATSSSPRATRSRFSWRFKAVGFEGISNGAARYHTSVGFERVPRRNQPLSGEVRSQDTNRQQRYEYRIIFGTRIASAGCYQNRTK